MKRSAWMFVIVFSLAACFLAGASSYTAAQSGELRYESELLAGNPAAAEGIELRQRAELGQGLGWELICAPESMEQSLNESIGRGRQPEVFEPPAGPELSLGLENLSYFSTSIPESGVIRDVCLDNMPAGGERAGAAACCSTTTRTISRSWSIAQTCLSSRTYSRTGGPAPM